MSMAYVACPMLPESIPVQRASCGRFGWVGFRKQRLILFCSEMSDLITAFECLHPLPTPSACVDNRTEWDNSELRFYGSADRFVGRKAVDIVEREGCDEDGFRIG
jgi:hypothetical protein